jgi:hypothetical protein
MRNIRSRLSWYDLKFEVRAHLKRRPMVYIPLSRLRQGTADERDPTRFSDPNAVRADTEIVIEGFYSSANTFAVVAFRLAQDRPVKMAHHLHAAAQLSAAAKLGVPTMVIIREPRAACTSRVVRHPPISLSQAMREYVDFYEEVSKRLPTSFIATFGAVTADFGAVIDRFNVRFGTSFRRFDHTAENVERVTAVIDERWKRKYGGVLINVARPSADRAALGTPIEAEYDASAMTGLRNRTEDLYRSARSAAQI